jgi:hypothetical protein
VSDIFFKKFYSDVKDESWPAIENYPDFLKLPAHIRQECVDLHKLNHRLEQIESQRYWQDSIATVYCYENLAFLPVMKCASAYYINLFENTLGWKKTNILDLSPGTVCVGVFEEPNTRYLKAITEWVYRKMLPVLNCDISKIPPVLLKSVIVGDCHSVPYTTLLGPWLDKINCIPMYQQSDEQIKTHLMNLFATQNHNIKLPINDQKLHQSGQLKLDLYKLVKQVYEDSLIDSSLDDGEYDHRSEFTYLMLAPDLKFYHNLLVTFDPSWQQIKFI